MEEVVSPLYRKEAIPNLDTKMPHEPVHYVLGRPMHSSKDDGDEDDDSEYAGTTSSDSLFDLSEIKNRVGGGGDRHSPPPSNDVLAEARNERRYRLLLEHQFHPSRKFRSMIFIFFHFVNKF